MCTGNRKFDKRKEKQVVNALIIASIYTKKEGRKGAGDVQTKSNSANNNNLRSECTK